MEKTKENRDFLYNPLYLISVDEEETPFLINGSLTIIYTDKEAAESFANTLATSYNNSTIKASLLQDNQLFFAKMWACGYLSFLLNGNGKIETFSHYINKSLKQKIKNPKVVAEGIEDAQLQKKLHKEKHIRLQTSGGSGPSLALLIKRLPSVHRKRLIGSYVAGLSTLILSIIFYLTEFNEIVDIFPLISFWIVIYGLTAVLKVSEKVKAKNPKAATVAKCSLILYILSIVIYVIKFING